MQYYIAGYSLHNKIEPSWLQPIANIQLAISYVNTNVFYGWQQLILDILYSTVQLATAYIKHTVLYSWLQLI